MTPEHYIDHEVRIRIQEKNALELKTDMKDLQNEMKDMRKMVHEQFMWTLGIMVTLFGGLIVTKFI